MSKFTEWLMSLDRALTESAKSCFKITKGRYSLAYKLFTGTIALTMLMVVWLFVFVTHLFIGIGYIVGAKTEKKQVEA